MADNQILKFCVNAGNILTQEEYQADTQRLNGVTPGVARSNVANKVWRQVSTIAAGVAKFIADNQSTNITDALSAEDVANFLFLAINSSLSVTAGQFDNDTSLATTAFVQRALGNYSGVIQYSNQTASILTAYAGRVVILSGSSNTLTLPLTNGTPNGASYDFYCKSGTSTILPASGNGLFIAGVSVPNIQLSASECAKVVLESTNTWAVISGTPLGIDGGEF